MPFLKESFERTAVEQIIKNVALADVKLTHKGNRYSLHDYFFAKSLDALRPGGVLALVTSHFTMDKQNAAIREYLADQADFVGAIRLPSDAFKREGTAVVTDIVFLRKRHPGEPETHVDPDWLKSGELTVDGVTVLVNQYFLNHPEMVLGDWSRKDTLYGEGISVISREPLADALSRAISLLPTFTSTETSRETADPAPVFVPPPLERHMNEGSFFVGSDRAIYQVEGGQGVPVIYGGVTLRADGTMTGKRLAGLIELRDRARQVLRSQNEGWPEEHREMARHELNRSYDRFVLAYGPINKTSFSETKDGSVIRRMPNIVKFREDPDAMLVMALEDYDEITGKADNPLMRGAEVIARWEFPAVIDHVGPVHDRGFRSRGGQLGHKETAERPVPFSIPHADTLARSDEHTAGLDSITGCLLGFVGREAR